MSKLLYDSVSDTYGSREDIKKARKLMCPAPWDVRTARHKTGLTMKESAELVYVTRDTWLRWERNPEHPEHSKMSPAYAELFALKTGLMTIEQLCPHLSKLNEN